MSRDAVNKRLKTVVVVPMTTFEGQTNDPSKLADQPPFRIMIPVSEIAKDPSCGSQLSLSVAKTDQVRVVDKSRLEGKIGCLSQTALLSVGGGVAFVLNIR